MNYLRNILSYDELKKVLSFVEQSDEKKIAKKKNYKKKRINSNYETNTNFFFEE